MLCDNQLRVDDEGDGKNPAPNFIASQWRQISPGTDDIMLSVPVANAGGYPSSRKYLYTVGLLSSHTRASSLTFRFPLTYFG